MIDLTTSSHPQLPCQCRHQDADHNHNLQEFFRWGDTAQFGEDTNKFVHQKDFVEAQILSGDPVFRTIAEVIRNTALRPKELLQLPYIGTGVNSGLQPYRIIKDYQVNEKDEMVFTNGEKLVTDNAQQTLITDDIVFEFESKGVKRRIYIPLQLWTDICKYWMPERAKRAKFSMANKEFEFRQKITDSCLFLSIDGRPVTCDMIKNHFRNVAHRLNHPAYGNRPFNSTLLRNACATFLVYEALKKNNALNADYVYNAYHDESLRQVLGHKDKGATYKFYVDIVHSYTRRAP